MEQNQNKKTIIFGGDILLGQLDYIISPDIVNLFSDADFGLLNLEGPILAAANCWPRPKAGPSVKQAPSIIKTLNILNVKYVSGANNHLMDYGINGLAQTKDILEANDVFLAGAGKNLVEASRPLTLKGTNIVIFCVAEEEFGVAGTDQPGTQSMYDDKILDAISEQKNNQNIVIIYAHGGGERIPVPSSYIISRYRQFITAGADLVVGHHPHIPQGFEQYQGKCIYYSLGNFIHSYFPNNWGALLKVTFEDNQLLEQKIYHLKLKEDSLFLIKNEDKYNNYLNDLNEIAQDSSLLLALLQEQSVFMYNDYYKKYFTGLFTNKTSLKQKILLIIKILTNSKTCQPSTRNTKDELLLLHLLKNNSHSEFITTALEVLTGEIPDKRSKQSSQLFYELNNFIKNE